MEPWTLFIVLVFGIMFGKALAEVLFMFLHAGLMYLFDHAAEKREIEEWEPEVADPVRLVPVPPRTKRIQPEKSERFVRKMP